MASSYFTIPSFARAKKNKEDLEKTNPKEPVLKDEDEKFFDKEMRSGSTVEGAKDAPATKITDDGEEKPVTAEEKEEAVGNEDQTVIPDNRPDSGIAQKDDASNDAPAEATTEAAASKTADGGEEKADTTEKKAETTEQKGDAITDDDQTVKPDDRPDSGIAQGDGTSHDDAQKETATEDGKERKEKKHKDMDLPSQEEAEASTRGFNAQAPDATQEGDKSQGEKKTWASYLPSFSKRPQSSGTSEQTPPPSAGGDGAEKQESEPEASKEGEKSTNETQPSQTWAEYASAYVPSMPASLTRKSNKTDADSTADPVYNADGTIDEAATAEKQEKEVSVLLDNLNLSSINNRVFSFSQETQHLYERFLLCLKDVVNGAPTAYEDMDKLMKEAGPKLEEQWKTMPPFVQTLVMSLPTRLGPEIMAAASENPNDEMRKNLQTASKSSAGGSGSGGGGVDIASAAMREGGDSKDAGGKEGEQKQKRKVPGLKSLMSGQGAVATLLRNTVSFIQTRFPFLASATNVVMSLAVFILMFVFWYCHKRGKEVRLAREADETGHVEEGDEDAEATDSAEGSDVEQMVGELEKLDEQQKEEGDAQGPKADVLNQSAPSEAPLPEKETKAEEGEKKEDGAAPSTA